MPKIQYVGPHPEGVDVPDHSLHFPHGEPVEVPADVAKSLLEQSDNFKAAAAKKDEGK